MNINILKKFAIVFCLIFSLSNQIVLAEEATEGNQTPEDNLVVEIVPTTINIHLEIASTDSLYNSDITVSPCDSDNNVNTVDTITPYCAILQTGIPSVWDWTWAPGAFVTSVGNISGYTSKDKDNNDVYHYWSWSLNGSEAMVGLNQYELESNDSILLNFVDPKDEPVIDEPVVEEPVVRSSSRSSRSVNKKTFSVPLAISYLSSNQKENGVFDDSLYTDWVAIGITGTDIEDNSLRDKILKYLKDEKFESSLITDYERHAMALLAFGIDPYTGTDVNYINKIISSYDGLQIGDISEYNDDIFGLIVLAHAGYDGNDEIINKVISFIISKQSEDGSWGNIDLTSASIQALSNFKGTEIIDTSISKGELYLINEQKINGGFNDNLFSTSWAIQALSMNNSFDDEVNEAILYLAERQQDDGGLEGSDRDSRVWSTAYAIPAVLHKSWNDILKNFPKQEIVKNLATANLKKEIIKNNTDKRKELPNIALKENSSEQIKIGTNLQASAFNSNNENWVSPNKTFIYIFSGLFLIAIGVFIFRPKF